MLIIAGLCRIRYRMARQRGYNAPGVAGGDRRRLVDIPPFVESMSRGSTAVGRIIAKRAAEAF